MSLGNTPTIKRILRESLELSTHPSPDIHAAPLSDSNVFEWHFTIRGPSPPSPFSNGIYHGRIILPPTYPLRPPSFRFVTPSGRFEVNREICLSISGHHEETWQPAWGIRTALVAIRAFMDSKVDGQVGGLECTEEVRVRLAGLSREWKCAECGKSNEEILEEEKRKCDEEERKGGKKGERNEIVPKGLRLGYRDELNKGAVDPAIANSTGPSTSPSSSSSGNLPTRTSSLLRSNGDASQNSLSTQSSSPPPPQPGAQPVPEHLRGPLPLYLHPMYRPTPPPQQQHQNWNRNRHVVISTPWLDRTIFALLFLLVGMVWRKLGI